MEHGVIAALRADAEKRAHKGYVLEVTPGTDAEKVECVGSCSGPRKDMTISLKVIPEGALLSVTFTGKDAVLSNKLVKQAGKFKQPRVEKITFEGAQDGSWKRINPTAKYDSNEKLASDLLDYLNR